MGRGEASCRQCGGTNPALVPVRLRYILDPTSPRPRRRRGRRIPCDPQGGACSRDLRAAHTAVSAPRGSAPVSGAALQEPDTVHTEDLGPVGEALVEGEPCSPCCLRTSPKSRSAYWVLSGRKPTSSMLGRLGLVTTLSRHCSRRLRSLGQGSAKNCSSFLVRRPSSTS